jgi:VWFA-related protein
VTQPFTRSRPAIEAAIRRVRSSGNTSLFTAVFVALSALRARRPAELGEVRRHAIVLLSDGYDTGSLVSYERVLELARRSNVAIYSISTGLRAADDVDGKILEGRYVLGQLAHVSGGRVLFPDGPANLINAFDEIADELSHQYTLAYMPAGHFASDDRWRTVLVRVDRPGLRATTRPGYVAAW